jgi:hypothetical protein
LPTIYRKFHKAVWPERKHQRFKVLGIIVPVATQARKCHLHVAVGKTTADAPHGARRDFVVGRLPKHQVAHCQGRLTRKEETRQEVMKREEEMNEGEARG